MHLVGLFEMVRSLTDKLTKADYRRIAASIDLMVEKHQEVSNDARMGFMYNGVCYRHSKARVIERLPMLAYSLCDEMNLILKDKEQVDLEKQQIGQILGQLIKNVASLQDLRNAIPDCLAALVPELANMQRQVEVESLIEDERLLRQYRKILPVIEVYSVGHLMY